MTDSEYSHLADAVDSLDRRLEALEKLVTKTATRAASLELSRDMGLARDLIQRATEASHALVEAAVLDRTIQQMWEEAVERTSACSDIRGLEDVDEEVKNFNANALTLARDFTQRYAPQEG